MRLQSCPLKGSLYSLGEDYQNQKCYIEDIDEIKKSPLLFVYPVMNTEL